MFDYGDLMTYILLLLKKMEVPLKDQSLEMRDLVQRTNKSQAVPVKLASGKFTDQTVSFNPPSPVTNRNCKQSLERFWSVKTRAAFGERRVVKEELSFQSAFRVAVFFHLLIGEMCQ